MDLRLAHLELVLKKEGLRAAVRYLNTRVAYRFTAINRLENDVFRVVEFIDKFGESDEHVLKHLPFSESLCRFPVLHGTFTTSHTAADPSLKGLVYPGAVGSYSGVRLTLANGEPFGTFCHYDVIPQSISHLEYQFLQLAVRLIARHLQAQATT